jgi:histone deacetylase 11
MYYSLHTKSLTARSRWTWLWLCRHPFDSSKWGRICKFLTKEGHLEKNRVVEPLEATKDDLLVVHSESYLNSLKSSLKVASIVEVLVV